MKRRCSLVGLFAYLSLALLWPATIRAQADAPAGAPGAEAAPESMEVQDTSARALRAQVLGLFESGQYGQLDALAQQLRTQKLRFRGGAWQLNVLYGVISSPGSTTSTDAEWEAHIGKLQQWIAASPTSATPRIALAQGYLNFAWKARGNGYAKTVTPEGWALFTQRVQSARTVLEEARALSANCPEWYHKMQTVALAQGWPRPQVELLSKAAMAHDPEYYYFALAQANYLLPKWYGKPGETETYVEQVADAVGGREGDALYFLVASRVNCCRRMQAPALSEAREERGFTALDQMYGSTNRERNEAAFLALRAGDTATAQGLFARIGNDWSSTVWGSKARFDASRTGQPVGEVPPVGMANVVPATSGDVIER